MEKLTPRKAAEDSARYLDELKRNDRSQISRLELKVELSHNGINHAEGLHTFTTTFLRGLEEIQQEEDPANRRELWVDLLNLQSRVEQDMSLHALPYIEPGYQTFNAAYNVSQWAHERLWREDLWDVKKQALVDVYGSVDAANADDREVYVRQFISDTTKAAIEAEDDVDFEEVKEGWFTKGMGEMLSRGNENPAYDKISNQTWDTLKHLVQSHREIKSWESEEPSEISPEALEYLDGSIDYFIQKIKEINEVDVDRVQKAKSLVGLDDEQIRRRAVEIVNERYAPLLQDAKEHAQKNLRLLKQAALAEAAMDGVQIKTRGKPRTPAGGDSSSNSPQS